MAFLASLLPIVGNFITISFHPLFNPPHRISWSFHPSILSSVTSRPSLPKSQSNFPWGQTFLYFSIVLFVPEDSYTLLYLRAITSVYHSCKPIIKKVWWCRKQSFNIGYNTCKKPGQCIDWTRLLACVQLFLYIFVTVTWNCTYRPTFKRSVNSILVAR